MFALCLSLCLAAFAQEPTWGRHTVPGQVLTVELPGAVEKRHGEKSSMIGTIVSETLVVQWEGGWAAATVTRIPTFASHLATEGNIFNTTKKSVLEEHQGELIAWVDLTKGAVRGKRMTYHVKKGEPRQGVSEIWTWEDRVATITAVYRPGSIPQAEVDRIFGSVRIAWSP